MQKVFELSSTIASNISNSENFLRDFISQLLKMNISMEYDFTLEPESRGSFFGFVSVL